MDESASSESAQLREIRITDLKKLYNELLSSLFIMGTYKLRLSLLSADMQKMYSVIEDVLEERHQLDDSNTN